VNGFEFSTKKHNIALLQNMNRKNNNSCYDLSNLNNYKSSLDALTPDIIKKYNTIIIDYLQFINENSNYKNPRLKFFIILNGLTTISHVFSMLLYYTKNLDLVCYHTKNAYFFYSEFIGQITEDKNSFLQLTPRDASLFVYKKSLFSIQTENIKPILKKPLNDVSNKKLDIVKTNIYILNRVITFFIEKNTENITDLVMHIKDIFKFVDPINNGKNYNITQKSFKTLLKLIEILKSKNVSSHEFCNIVEEFIKNYNRKINDYYKSSVQNELNEQIMDKLMNIEFKDGNGVGEDLKQENICDEFMKYLF